MSYWDTSALVKFYVVEPDTAVFEALALASPVVTSGIARHEARTVFRRREAEGALPPGAGAALFQRLEADIASGMVHLFSDSADIEQEFGLVLDACFSHVPPIFVRTNDALHLAAAHAAGETDFVTADMRQRTAARLLGLNVRP